MAQVTINQPQYLKLGVLGLLEADIEPQAKKVLVELLETVNPLDAEEMGGYFRFLCAFTDALQDKQGIDIPPTIKHLTTAGWCFRVYKEVDDNGKVPWGLFHANIYDACGMIVATRIGASMEQLREILAQDFPGAKRAD